MDVKTTVNVVLTFTEQVEQSTIEELEKEIGYKLGSKEHRELVEYALQGCIERYIDAENIDAVVTNMKSEKVVG